MIVYSINPNNGNYFKDASDHVNFDDIMYQGTYNYTPTYPRYTFNVSDRFNYTNNDTSIIFYTMLKIKRSNKKYFVEVRFKYLVDAYYEDSLEQSINEFNKFCKDNIKNLDIKNLN